MATKKMYNVNFSVFPKNIFLPHFVGNKAEGRISKLVFQENKARTCAYRGRGRGGVRNVRFYGKFDVHCFLERPVLRFALLPYYRRFQEVAFNFRMYLYFWRISVIYSRLIKIFYVFLYFIICSKTKQSRGKQKSVPAS